MSETDVHAKLVLDDSASAALAKIAAAFEHASHSAKETEKSGGSALSRMKEIAGGELIARGIEMGFEKAKEAVDLLGEAFHAAMGELEGRKAVAGVLAMTDTTGKSFDQLSDKATLFKEDLADMALKAGESEATLTEVFTSIAARSNKSAVEVEKLTESMAMAGRAVPGGIGTLGQGFAQMETGVVRARNPVVQLIAATHLLHGNAKQVAAQMAHMSQAQQLALGEKAVEKMAQKMKDVPPTLTQLTTSLAGMGEEVLKNLGMPMVQAVLPPLGELRDFLLGNKDAILGFARTVGEYVGATIDELRTFGVKIAGILGPDSEHLKEMLMDAGGFLKNVFEAGIKTFEGVADILARLLGEVSEIYSKVKSVVGGAAESGALGGGARQLAMGMEATRTKAELREGAGASADPEVMAKQEKLREMYRAQATAAGDSAEEINLFLAAMNRTANSARVTGAELESTSQVLSKPEMFTAAYNRAAKAHDEGSRAYAAKLVADSDHLLDAMLKAGIMPEGGFTGLIESAGKAGVSKERLEIMRKKVEAGAAGEKTQVNMNFTGPISIKQDFRDQDPDRVAVIFRNDLAKNATNRLGARTQGPLGVGTM